MSTDSDLTFTVDLSLDECEARLRGMHSIIHLYGTECMESCGLVQQTPTHSYRCCEACTSVIDGYSKNNLVT